MNSLKGIEGFPGISQIRGHSGGLALLSALAIAERERLKFEAINAKHDAALKKAASPDAGQVAAEAARRQTEERRERELKRDRVHCGPMGVSRSRRSCQAKNIEFNL